MARRSSCVFVCVALTIVALLFKGWATPDTINAVKGLYADAAVQDRANKELLAKIKSLTERMHALEKNGKSTKHSIENEKKYFENLNKLLNAKSNLRLQSAPEIYKAEEINPAVLNELIEDYNFQKKFIKDLQNNQKK